MADFKVKVGNESFVVRQSARDLIEGMKRGGDLSRISVCGGPDMGVHTGSRSETVGRHGKPFGKG